jgi:hypothetical protein
MNSNQQVEVLKIIVGNYCSSISIMHVTYQVACQIVVFFTRYVKLAEGVDAASVLEWHLPVNDRTVREMPISKLISRFQLCLSKTMDLFEVAADKLRVVPDIRGKGVN